MAVIDAYARYHNYTLRHALHCKQKNQKMFRDADLLYILDSLAAAAHTLTPPDLHHPYQGLFRDHRVFLSTEGFLKVYPFRLHTSPHASQLSLAETSQESVDVDYEPPEKEKSHGCFRTGLSDLRDLGFLSAQLCLLESKEELEKLSRECVRFRLERGLAGRVSSGLRKVVLKLLEGEEYDWQTLREAL